jgi:hypothetical protein
MTSDAGRLIPDGMMGPIEDVIKSIFDWSIASKTVPWIAPYGTVMRRPNRGDWTGYEYGMSLGDSGVFSFRTHIVIQTYISDWEIDPEADAE